jgi:non-homologous end joining protein Ku
MVGKRIQFDDATWQALDMLARDRMMNFQEIADEAFADLLQKHDRPVDLKDALKRSVRHTAPGDVEKRAGRAARGRHD